MKAENEKKAAWLREAAISFLAGSEEVLVQIRDQAPLQPFDPRTLDFLAALSGRLREDSQIRSFSDVAAFAFWCRRGNLLQEQAACAPWMEDRACASVLHIRTKSCR
jgi:hypothetical protein